MRNKEPSKRKPFTDVDEGLLKPCQIVEVLNGVLPGYVLMAKVIRPGEWESTVELDKKGEIRNVRNEILRIRIF